MHARGFRLQEKKGRDASDARGFRLQEKKGRDGQKALARLLIKPASCMPTPSSCTSHDLLKGGSKREDGKACREAGRAESESESEHAPLGFGLGSPRRLRGPVVRCGAHLGPGGRGFKMLRGQGFAGKVKFGQGFRCWGAR